MMKSIFFTLSLAALGMAQSSTVPVPPPTPTTAGPVTIFNLLVPAASPVPSEASIVAVGQDAITFALDIGCLPNLISGRCEEIEEFDFATIIQGPETYSQSASLSGIGIDAACSLGGTTTAACTFVVESGGIDATLKTTLSGSELETAFVRVTATAGIEKLAEGAPNAGPRETGNVNWVVGGAAAALAMAAAL
ncbi:hypothetical protein EMPG_14541 [Blastomyces silverae]|uniref:Uncharacterized protein n=1 Tax=Blastomyces silverae TaxID=2060906 RepID=A0A0H1BLJ6_9EURO|nr:hypothetical protein EMPG_14541 [Blastomyces silverae]